MLRNGNIAERVRIDSQALTISSVATASSIPVSMEDCDKCAFVVSLGTAAAALQPTITVYQATAATHAGSTVKSTTIGSSAAARILNGRRVLLTFTTDSTAATAAVVINGITFAESSDTSLFQTASAASARTFGSTLDSSAAGGLENRVQSITSAINNSTFGVPGITCSTASTAAVYLQVDDTASTTINIDTCMSGLTPSYLDAQAIVEIQAADLTSGCKWAYVHVSTVATSVRIGIASVRVPLRHGPAKLHGTLLKST